MQNTIKIKPENKWILCWAKTVLYDCNDPANVDFMTDQLYMEEFGYETL